MQPINWLRSSSLRRGVAAGSVALSAAGLVALSLPDRAGAHNMQTTPIWTTPDNAAGSQSSMKFAGPGLEGTLALSQSRVLAGQAQTLYLDATLRGVRQATAAGQAQRTPLSIVLVLDTSGSMAGDKLVSAARSIERFASRMHDEDEVALVRYADHSEVLLPLGRVGAVRASLRARLGALSASGGTNIPSGLHAARGLLPTDATGRAQRVVLVSDGIDQNRIAAERAVSDAEATGVITSAMGVGNDFDERYMSAIASRGHGHFVFAKDGAELAGFFARELDEASAMVASNTKLTIQLPSGARFVRAFGAESRIEGSSLTLTAGALAAGEERRILIELETSLQSGDARTIAMQAAWLSGYSNGAPTANSARAAVSFSAQLDAAQALLSRDGELYARAVSVVASNQQVEAAAAYASGDTRRAETLMLGNAAALESAASAAPPAAKAALAVQASRYAQDRDAFRSAAPGSEAGKGHAKAAAARDFGNLSSAAEYAK